MLHDEVAVSRRPKRRRVAPVALVLLAVVLTLRPGRWLPGAARWLAVGDTVLAPADVIIVLSGERGERVETAVELYRQGLAPRLLLTGGPVEWNVPAADIMAWQAKSLGVPEENMVLERRASSTYENAVYSLAILKERGWRSAIVVTSPYHLRRTRFIFERVSAEENIRLSFYGAEGRGLSRRDGGARIRAWRLWG
ncbi:MAG: YdcF family protein [Clostridia bacterium]|nr:YdcF family protein [Clostridia bacterium]